MELHRDKRLGAFNAKTWVWAVVAGGLLALQAQAATPAELLAAYTAQAGRAASPDKGQQLFTKDFGGDLGSCASCHGVVPVKEGKDAVSEKKIAPLAPSANASRFTDRAIVEAKFRLNCKDLMARECTAAEKADILSWLLTLKP
jgi:cytochrome c553